MSDNKIYTPPNEIKALNSFKMKFFNKDKICVEFNLLKAVIINKFVYKFKDMLANDYFSFRCNIEQNVNLLSKLIKKN